MTEGDGYRLPVSPKYSFASHVAKDLPATNGLSITDVSISCCFLMKKLSSILFYCK